jgi:pilus assembly protein CpaE
MSYRVLLGIADPVLAEQARATISEDREFFVVDIVPDGSQVVSTLGRTEVDALLIHEDLGPLPVMDFARDLGARYPHVGIVLIARDPTPEMLRSALQSGMRDVVSIPLSFEEVQEGVRGAAAWSRMVRERMSSEAVVDTLYSLGGRMIVLAGAKGGVGTTSIAVHLALDAARRSRGRTVCLVDFDLQAGDVGLLLDLAHRRSVTDLREAAHDLSPRQLENTTYRHSSGLRVLLAPNEGEFAEEIDMITARRILGALRSYYDIVIVDVGSVVSDANAVATEMADEVFIVTTPDVPALRAANRLMSLWERLQARKEGIRVILNRVNKDLEVQPDLVRKVVNAPLTKTVLPAAFKHIEPAVNAGAPDRLADGALRKALSRLAVEIEVLPRAGEEQTKKQKLAERLTPTATSESGQATAETVALAPIVALVVVGLYQMVLVGLTFVFAGHAAREGARELAVGGNVDQAVVEDLPSAWREEMSVDEGADYVEVTLRVPALAPGLLESPWSLSVRAGTVVEEAAP